MPTQPLPLTEQETGIDVGVGLQVFLITAEGKIVENPCHYRTAERELKKAPKRVSQRKQGTGEEPAQESGAGARQEASAGPPAAHGLSPQDRPGAGPPVRHDLSYPVAQYRCSLMSA